MILRPARLQDAQRLFDWRNHPSTRAMMHETGALDFSAHSQWLEKSLSLSTRALYIAEIEGVPVGTVRTDLINGATQFSWTIDPDQRGRGFGKQMVRMALERIEGPVHVEVKAENTASARIAQACGLKQSGEVDGVLQFRRD